MAELNKDAALLWAEALESGRYKQGKNWLAITDLDGVVRYCCLGVACETYIGHVDAQFHRSYSGNTNYYVPIIYGEEKDAWNLPKKVVEWLGIDELETQSKFVRLNDTLNWSFDQIAAEIRRMADLPQKTDSAPKEEK